MNPYDTLGVTEKSSPEEVERAYKKLRMRAHPDHGGSAEAFDKLQRAHKTLTTPVLRALYDDHGYVGELSEDHQQRASAFDALVYMMNQYIEHPDVELIDLRALMLANIKQIRSNTLTEMTSTKSKASKLLRLACRWRSAKGRNPLANALERQAAVLTERLEESADVLKLNEVMEQILLTEFEYVGGSEFGSSGFFRQLTAPGSVA